MHCTSPTSVFAQISDSGDLRKADMLAMLDPAFKAFLDQEGPPGESLTNEGSILGSTDWGRIYSLLNDGQW